MDNGRFQNLRFSIHPSAAPQTVFPVGTGEVFALWEYADMQPGDWVQRVWTYNGANWLTRDEIWDTAGRGVQGTVTDVSIFDKAIGGLAPGEYSLALYLNGEWQTGGQFTILSRPSAGQPGFSNLYFTAYPNGPAQTQFPAGTQQVFAVWTYHNMGVNDVVKREWGIDGAVWLEREEVWDYFHYGPEGVVTDVSVYNFESGGLASGRYTLSLYLNGKNQAAGAFTIGP
jgi:hypothetical protein